MTNEYVLRLQETTAPSGELALSDLALLCYRIQELATRVSRWTADIDGPGRGPRPVEAAATLRLTGISRGSTVLHISSGPHDVLDFDTSFEADVAERFWGVVSAIAEDAPPDDAPVLVRQSAVGLIDALDHAAGSVEFVRAGRPPLVFRPAERDRHAWNVATPPVGAESITITGRLEKVDLRSKDFRIADDAGNRIALHRVRQADDVGALVGRRAVARGLPTRDATGVVTRLDDASVEAADLPAWFEHRDPEHWAPPRWHAGPDPAGAVILTDDEWDTFAAAVKGA